MGSLQRVGFQTAAAPGWAARPPWAAASESLLLEPEGAREPSVSTSTSVLCRVSGCFVTPLAGHCASCSLALRTPALG